MESPDKNGNISVLTISSNENESLSSNTSPIEKPRALTPKLEVMMKREAKRKEEEEQYTYKPKINSVSAELASNDRIDAAKRFETLYQDAKKRKEQHATLSTIHADTNLTFKPNIKRNSSSKLTISTEDSMASTSSKVNVNEIVERLYKPESVKKSSRSSTPTDVKSYSFNPKISKRANSIDRQSLIDIGDRLFNQSKAQKEKLEKMKEAEVAKEAALLTFSPRITTKSRSLSQGRMSKEGSPREIGERLMKYDEIKRKKLEAAAEERKKAELEEATFKPVINESSKRFATPTRTGDLFERLSKPVDKDGLASKQIAELEASYFQPQLIAKRAPSVASLSTAGESVHERLFKDAEQQKIKLEKERLIRESIELKDATFNPKINQRAEELAPEKSVFQRLSTNKQYVQEVLSQLKTDMELAECTFKPQIIPRPGEDPNQTSGKGSSEAVHLRLLAEGERLKQDKKKLEEERLSEEMKGLTFKPELVSSYQMTKDRNASGPIHERLNAEGEKLKLEKKKLEDEAKLEESKALTFTPSIPKKSKSIVITKSKDSTDPMASFASPTKTFLNSTAKKSDVFTPKPPATRAASASKVPQRNTTPQRVTSFGKKSSSISKSTESNHDLDVQFEDIYKKVAKTSIKGGKALDDGSDSSYEGEIVDIDQSGESFLIAKKPNKPKSSKSPTSPRSSPKNIKEKSRPKSTGNFAKPTTSSIAGQAPVSNASEETKPFKPFGARGPSPLVKTPVHPSIKAARTNPPSSENSTTVSASKRAASPKTPSTAITQPKLTPSTTKSNGSKASQDDQGSQSVATENGDITSPKAKATPKAVSKPPPVNVSSPPANGQSRSSSAPKQASPTKPPSPVNRLTAEELFKRASMTAVPPPVKATFSASPNLKVAPPKPGPSPSAASSKPLQSPAVGRINVAPSPSASVTSKPAPSPANVSKPAASPAMVTRPPASAASVKKLPEKPADGPVVRVVPRRGKSVILDGQSLGDNAPATESNSSQSTETSNDKVVEANGAETENKGPESAPLPAPESIDVAIAPSINGSIDVIEEVQPVIPPQTAIVDSPMGDNMEFDLQSALEGTKLVDLMDNGTEDDVPGMETSPVVPETVSAPQSDKAHEEQLLMFQDDLLSFVAPATDDVPQPIEADITIENQTVATDIPSENISKENSIVEPVSKPPIRTLPSTKSPTPISAQTPTDGPPAHKVLRGGSRKKSQDQPSLESAVGPLLPRGES